MTAEVAAFLAVAKIVGLRLTPWQVQVLELMYTETDAWCPACAGNRAQQHALPHHTPREENRGWDVGPRTHATGSTTTGSTGTAPGRAPVRVTPRPIRRAAT